MPLLIRMPSATSLAPNAMRRIADMARNAGDLTPLREPVRKVLWEANKARALAGVDADGNRYKALAASTIERRQGNGPPLAPRGPQSRIVTGFVVSVSAGPGRLTFTGSWPELDWIEYHVNGTKRMPRRNPLGFRLDELEGIRRMLAEHIAGRR